MRESPCINCEKSGCGAYHDRCEAYQAALAQYAARKNAYDSIRSKELLLYDDKKYRLKRFRAGSR